MKVVIPGGTGHLGRLLARRWVAAGHEVVVLGRRANRNGAARHVLWDGRNPGDWEREIDGADVVVNLAGRSVDCRYSAANLREMMDSRVFSTRAVGAAIAKARRPPAVWLQMSTATIYAHRFDADNDEASGVIGGEEPDAPAYWRSSIEIATAWERTLAAAATPDTRRVALRTAMVMSDEPGQVFAILRRLALLRLGGRFGDGRQYVSWIHERDFARAVEFLIARDDLDGAINLAAPAPLPQERFLRALREALGVRIGLPSPAWLLELGAWVRRSDTELLLKSRRVVPGRLLDAGFRFEFSRWTDAARELAGRAATRRSARVRGAREGDRESAPRRC